MYDDILIELGLSEKEAKVYLALLELGTATASQIAATTKVNRSTVHVALKALEKRGFALHPQHLSVEKESTVRRFVAASPDSILKAARERSRRSRAIQMKIESVIPRLKAMHKGERHIPKLYVYEGPAAESSVLGLVQEQAARGLKCIRIFGDAAVLSNLKSEFRTEGDGESMGSMIQNDQISLDALDPNPHANAVVTRAQSQKSRHLRDPFADLGDAHQTSHRPTALVIYEDKFGFYSTDLHFLVFENKPMADLLKRLFELAKSRNAA